MIQSWLFKGLSGSGMSFDLLFSNLYVWLWRVQSAAERTKQRGRGSTRELVGASG